MLLDVLFPSTLPGRSVQSSLRHIWSAHRVAGEPATKELDKSSVTGAEHLLLDISLMEKKMLALGGGEIKILGFRQR